MANGLNVFKNQADLSNVIDMKRWKDWKTGTCIKCGKEKIKDLNKLELGVGECGVCLNCEMNWDRNIASAFAKPSNIIPFPTERNATKPAANVSSGLFTLLPAGNNSVSGSYLFERQSESVGASALLAA
jgi:hypothetical protein